MERESNRAMGPNRFSAFRSTLALCTSATVLWGCAGSPGPPPVAGPIAPVAARPKGGSLLYVVGQDAVYVVSYPAGEQIGKIATQASAACAAKSGNVFITRNHGVDEYAHGGLKPIKSLQLPYTTNGCSINPTNGDLAVTNGGYVAIFRKARGYAVEFSAGIEALECGYDDKGNLFVDGYADSSAFALAEQPRGYRNFEPITLPPNMHATAGQVQWDGRHLSIESGNGQPGDLTVYRLKIAGSKATLAGTVSFKNTALNAGLSWINAERIIVPFQLDSKSKTSAVGYWRYPAGGAPRKVVQKGFGKKSGALYALTVSVAR